MTRLNTRHLIIPVFLVLVLLAACTQGDGSLSAPTSEPGITEGWKEVEAPGWTSQPGFALRLPQGWELKELQGIDSYVGEIVGDGVELHFDYGAYSWNLNLSDEPEHAYHVAYEEIGGVEAKLIWPKDSSQGVTGVYFADLGGPQLNFIGRDLTQEQQTIAWAIFRSVRSLD